MSAPPDIAKKAAPGGARTFSGHNTNEKTNLNRTWASRQLLPPPETGVHSWLYGRACHLRREGFEQVAALSELRHHVGASTFRAGRSVSDREIVDAIESAYKCAAAPAPHLADDNVDAGPRTSDYDEAAGWHAEMPLPHGEVDRQRLACVLGAAGSFALADLWETAPLRPPNYAEPRWALGQLFGEADVLCVGSSSADFAAKPLHDWTNSELLTAQLVVPNPLRKLTGTTKSGKESAHSRDATGPRRYIIVESDAGLDTEQQVQVLEHLRVVTKGRLAAVVLSGGKSVHGWFRCDGVPIAKLHRWFSYALTLGADPRLWLPEQFVRLPDGLRDNRVRQNLMFLNPSA